MDYVYGYVPDWLRLGYDRTYNKQQQLFIADGKKNLRVPRKVKVINRHTGEVVGIFHSMHAVSRTIGMTTAKVKNVIDGRYEDKDYILIEVKLDDIDEDQQENNLH